MACPSGTPCSPAPAEPGSWTFTANPNASRFCDARLEGLSHSNASAGTNLVAVDPLTGCLTRPDAPKGTWQHDPNGCQPDFVGPLDDPSFTNVAAHNTAKTHFIPGWELSCDSQSIKRMVAMAAPAGNEGLPAMLREECCAGGVRWATMAPEYLINGRETAAGTCASPRVLGYVPYTRTVCDGKSVTEYRWYSLSRWQQDDAAAVVEADIFDPADGETQNLWFTFWRTETCTGGGSVKQLVKADVTQVKRVLGIGANGNYLNLDPQPVIYSQHKSVTPGSASWNYYLPDLPVSGSLPITDSTVTVNLEDITGWAEDWTHVVLDVYLKGTTITQLFDMCIVISGKEYARVSLPGDDAGGNSNCQITLPIPSNHQINVQLDYQVTTPGDVGSVLAMVYLVAFERK
jgi:hypothetical protein